MTATMGPMTSGRMRLRGNLARLGSFRSLNATRSRLQTLTKKRAE